MGKVKLNEPVLVRVKETKTRRTEYWRHEYEDYDRETYEPTGKVKTKILTQTNNKYPCVNGPLKGQWLTIPAATEAGYNFFNNSDRRVRDISGLHVDLKEVW